MTRSPTPSAASIASDAVAREVIDRLQGILSQVDAFLADWLERYEAAPQPPAVIAAAPLLADPRKADVAAASEATTAVPDPANPAPEYVLAQRMAQFESDKRRWQTERDSETRRLEEKFQHLTAGWLHLETERRALLQSQRTPRSRRPPEASEANEAVTNRPNGAAQAANPFPQPVANQMPGGEVRGGDAVQQFQQLRRQIDSSREPRDQS